MSAVPLDLQRRCEQRWAAQFRRPVEPTADQEDRLEKLDQQLAAAPREQKKNSPANPIGFEAQARSLSAGPKPPRLSGSASTIRK